MLGLGLGLATSAHAVTVNLAATIGEVGQNHSSGPGVVGLFAIGDGVQFSFDYRADDSVPAGDNNGMKYVVTRFTLTTPVYTATVLGRGALKFAHQPNYDTFSMYSGIADLTETYGVPIPGVPLLNGFYLSSFGFNLEATGGGAFKSNSLRQPLIAGDFDAFNLHFSFREPGSTRAVGTMQSWQLDALSSTALAVPEPASAALLLAGALLLGVWSDRTPHRRRAADAARVASLPR